MAKIETNGKAGAAVVTSISCREITGQDCDYVAQADGNSVSTVGYLVDQVITLLGQHMGQVHRSGLGSQERQEIRERFRGA